MQRPLLRRRKVLSRGRVADICWGERVWEEVVDRERRRARRDPGEAPGKGSQSAARVQAAEA